MRLVSALACAWLVGIPLAASSAQGDDLERLRAVARTHPDDADWAWALALELRRLGRDQEALEHLQALCTARPAGPAPPSPLSPPLGLDRPHMEADCDREIGPLLYERGRHAEALAVLARVVERDPTDGLAHLYIALSLQALGRHAEAETELGRAAELSPALSAETQLLRALGRLSLGDQVGGRQFLDEAIAFEPTGHVGERAREVLHALGSERPRATAGPRGSVWVRVGAESDSNVTLDSGSIGGASTDESDVRAGWGAGFALHAARGEWGSFTLGYGYGETAHENLKQMDLRSHQPFGSLLLRLPRGLSFRLDALGSDVQLDDDPYLRSWTARPNLFVPIDDRWGVTRVYAEIERRSFHDEPFVSSLDRDGSVYSVGLEQHLRFARLRNAALVAAVVLGRTNTEASSDALGFNGDYDDRFGRLRLDSRVSLPRDFYLNAGTGVALHRYRNENLIDRLTDGGVGTLDPDRRRDRIVDASAAFGWSFTANLSVELRWQGFWSHSNVDAYDYERHIAGLHFVARRPIP